MYEASPTWSSLRGGTEPFGALFALRRFGQEEPRLREAK